MVDNSSAVSDNVGAAPDSSAGGAGGGPSDAARQAATTNAQSEGPLGKHLLDAARRQQDALVGNISSLLTRCSSRNRRPEPSDARADSRTTAESNLSAAASSRAEPNNELPTKAKPATGGLATLAAFGHGGGSSEDTYYFKPKRANDRGENEQRMLELFMKAQRRGEPIAEHAPEYHGLEARDGQPNFKMTNLIYDFVEPRLLDCKVGVRCHTESEATNAKLRTDLCERWRKMDPSVLTEEELERGSITKSRWMALRDSRSSTQRLGFRIDAVATPHGHKTAFDSELHSVREDQHVLETFRWFLPQAAECEGCHPREIAGEILVKLRRLETALRAWADFWHNEFIGSSVLFMADATGRADLKMIDFGVTTPCEAGLKHDTPWVMGNHEDGYLLGLANLIRLWNQLLVEDVWL